MNKNNKIIESSMLDDFDVQGLWWIPVIDDKDIEKLPGNLYSENGRFFLDVIGSFSEDDFNMNVHDYIYGFTVKGEEVTLFNCLPAGSKFNMPGLIDQKITVDSFLVGGHFDNVDEFKFHSVNISSTYLTKWFNTNPFRQKREKDDESKVIGHTTTIIMPEINKFYVPHIEAEFCNRGYFKSGGNRNENSNYIYNESFVITPTKLKNYKWFEEIFRDLNKLLTLLINEPVYFKTIVFEDENIEILGEIKKRKKYHLYLSQGEVKENKKIISNRMLLTYKDVKANFGNILNNWFKKKAELKNVYSLYLGDFYNESVVLETNFLNAIQTLEVYHRAQGRGKFFNDELKEDYLNTINKVLDGQVPEEIKKRVSNELKYFNEYTLRKRLEEILKDLDDETVSYLFRSRGAAKDFFYKSVITRNDLTHFGEDMDDKIFKGVDIHYATSLLKILSVILLFIELGLEENKILEAIKNNFNLSYRISNSKVKLGLN